ncbi:MAG: hypothetical protein Q9167_006376 [Letrouitia subvulpina]
MDLRDHFNALPPSPNQQELEELGQKIDEENLRVSPSRENDDLLVRLALYLSLPTQSQFLIEIQLRCLVGALALLRHNRATLDVEPFDSLRRNIAGRFKSIVDSRRESQRSLVDYNQWFLRLYLVRLAWQYFQLFFRRGLPLIEAIAVPAIGLALSGASAAGGSYNGLQEIFKHMDDIIAVVGKRKQRMNLAGLQELVRLATTRFRLSQDSQPHLAEAMNIVEQILQQQDLPLNDIAPRRTDKFLSLLRQTPPRINKQFFFTGSSTILYN